MVIIKENVKDLNLYLKEMIWFVLKPLIIFGIICLFLSGYFYIAKTYTGKTALGVLILVIIIEVPIVVRSYFYYKKILKAFFNDTDAEGNVELTITLTDDEFVIENLSRKSIGKIKKSEIKTIKASKKCIFIKTTMKQIAFFPKTTELSELFGVK